jgi:hypothetical protein
MHSWPLRGALHKAPGGSSRCWNSRLCWHPIRSTYSLGFEQVTRWPST